ncbi:PP2C family protein-serine/threonine phosphatase [Jannaschia rubra]|uniref:PP2C-family Ser/Thr phosphatase n=1 Tax=Jannaschia rubra TaxID=282197 RepID=A0A0M6XSI5_9RHOB|nr:protein phosphatase 2C domain-containing protein [Jannaschia rubra]CTQ33161.1 PP2C-family Ser/Thr phosphatase [Jannaschia rubra]SFG79817.1 protein phosphatase [Jannaschia rubra]
MWRSPEPRHDVASALVRGGRSQQEDAVLADFPCGTDGGIAVLSDGMGGHAAGDVASRIVVTEVHADPAFARPAFAADESAIPRHLARAAHAANAAVRHHVRTHPQTRGMGATLVSVVLVGDRMFWMSMGDSPLYLLRGGRLHRLDEDHSLAPRIDLMADRGLITPMAARDRSDRHCLTSVIPGGEVAGRDCPALPFALRPGDVVLMASDGVQVLDAATIGRILHRNRRRPAARIAACLLSALGDLADPDRDNVALCVIKPNPARAPAAAAPLAQGARP